MRNPYRNDILTITLNIKFVLYHPVLLDMRVRNRDIVELY